MIMRFLNRYDSAVSVWIDLSSIIAISADSDEDETVIKMASASLINYEFCFEVEVVKDDENEPNDAAIARVIRAWVAARRQGKS